jgi:hypothetical protein
LNHCVVSGQREGRSRLKSMYFPDSG